MERDHLEDLGVDGDNIKMGRREIFLAQVRDGWWAFVNAVMNLRSPWFFSWIADDVGDSQEGLCSM
jgi:hypothetical protein